jgi:hypothetical protein
LLALEIFGLNLSLTGKTVVASCPKKEKSGEQKPRPERGAGREFLLYNELKNLKPKSRRYRQQF